MGNTNADFLYTPAPAKKRKSKWKGLQDVSESAMTFFSYSREDSEFVLRLAKDLRAAGAKIWVDRLDIGPGQRWDAAVEETLRVSPRQVAVLSPAAVSSVNVMDEVSFALEEHKEVIPVLYRDCQVPFRLRRVQYIDFRTDYDGGLRELLKVLGVEKQPEVPVDVGWQEARPLHDEETHETPSSGGADERENRESAEPARKQEQERLDREAAEVARRAEKRRTVEAAEPAPVAELEYQGREAADKARGVEAERRAREAEHVARAAAARREEEARPNYKSAAPVWRMLPWAATVAAVAAMAIVVFGLYWFSHKNEPPSNSSAGTEWSNAKDGQNYVWIPPGTFQMGCLQGDSECYEDEKPAHTVKITKGFWMGQTEVTQAAYQRVMGDNPSKFRGPQLPVDSVPWNDANSYCEKAGMRLPTEAEWEYAARAGSTKPRYGELDAIAWHPGNSGHETHEVGQKQANAWKLYDMLGNVWEWVGDWYGRYGETLSEDPKGPSKGQYSLRVLRGGSCDFGSWNLRAAIRLGIDPGYRGKSIGFRCSR